MNLKLDFSLFVFMAKISSKTCLRIIESNPGLIGFPALSENNDVQSYKQYQNVFLHIA